MKLLDVNHRQLIAVAHPGQNPAFQRATEFVAAFFQGRPLAPAAATGRNAAKKQPILHGFITGLSHRAFHVLGKHNSRLIGLRPVLGAACFISGRTTV